MVPIDGFGDPFLSNTYAGDEPVQFDCGDATSAVNVPERLFARAQSVARAYELHLLPTIDICSRTRLNRPQCETLLDEINFIAMVANDDLLRERRRGSRARSRETYWASNTSSFRRNDTSRATPSVAKRFSRIRHSISCARSTGTSCSSMGRNSGELMLRCGLGATEKRAYKVYDVDEDFFAEDE